ncbi:MAG TPA: VOC family protein [Thermoleophilaceae bacterium]|nr:VOC family protein [Thermoleophilaceae bacterium]
MTSSAPSPTATLPATARLGAVHITVSDLDRSVDFYERAIGLRLHRREDGTAAMGAGGEDVLVLVEQPGALPAGRHAGLYHFALLHPSRLELARAAMRLATTRTPIEGASDHGISEAIYLPDPDGNGIELASDFPKEQWPDLSDPATYAGGPKPLDLYGLLELAGSEGSTPYVDPGLTVGHVHLHVGDIPRALAFYRDLLGFDVMTEFPGAAFVAAGGYHHHVGLNVWRGQGVPPAPADRVGLHHWILVLPNADLEALRARVQHAGIAHEERPDGLLLRDPWGIALLVTPV